MHMLFLRTAWPEQPREEWRASANLCANAEDVLTALTDPEAIAVWAPVSFEVEGLTEGRLEAGSRERVAGLLAGGAVTGVVAVLAAREISGVLYQVSVGDPFSWGGAAVLLLTVSAFANLIPAWRASRVDPSEALRIE